MKKRTTKLISILLTLVMLLGLMPTTALAAEEENIDSISATVTLPTAGAHPVETGTPGDSSYKIIRVGFSEKDPETGLYTTSLESTDTFEAGKTYMVNVLFRANSGYAIDRNTVSVAINGQTAAWWSTIADGWNSMYFYIEYTVPAAAPAENITELTAIGVVAPVPGEYPSVSGITAPAGAHYTIGKVSWRSNTDPTWIGDTTFKEGYVYRIYIAFLPDAGYEISKSATPSLEGVDYWYSSHVATNTVTGAEEWCFYFNALGNAPLSITNDGSLNIPAGSCEQEIIETIDLKPTV